ncbi:hypothetical protein RI367_007248 [Sorochytrium milnesiophthora]
MDQEHDSHLLGQLAAIQQQLSDAGAREQALLQAIAHLQQQQQQQQHQQPSAPVALFPAPRLPVPTFDGVVPDGADLTFVSATSDITIFTARLQSYFAAMHVNEEQVRLAVLENALTGPAAAWYWSLAEGHSPFTSWGDAQAAMAQRFAQPARRIAQQQAFFDLR